MFYFQTITPGSLKVGDYWEGGKKSLPSLGKQRAEKPQRSGCEPWINQFSLVAPII